MLLDDALVPQLRDVLRAESGLGQDFLVMLAQARRVPVQTGGCLRQVSRVAHVAHGTGVLVFRVEDGAVVPGLGILGELADGLHLAEGHPVVGEALDIMLDHLEDTLTVGQIAEIMCVSPRRLERSFGEKLNQSPLQVYRSLRLEQAEQLLKQTDLPISEISIACGFSNVTLLSKWYTQKFGVQPSIARKSAYRGKCAA